MPLFPLLAGAELTATFFNDSVDNCRSVKYQTADQTRTSSTTYLDSTSLLMPVVANGVYQFDSCLFYDTSATADVKIRMTLPAGSAALIAPWSSGTGITGATNSINQQGAAPVSNVLEWVAGGVATNTVMSIRPVGWINIGGTAGNLVIGHAQNASSAVNTVLKQGSWIAVSRVL